MQRHGDLCRGMVICGQCVCKFGGMEDARALHDDDHSVCPFHVSTVGEPCEYEVQNREKRHRDADERGIRVRRLVGEQGPQVEIAARRAVVYAEPPEKGSPDGDE